MATNATPNPNSPHETSPPFITQSEILAEFSHHDPDVARINNGSFGCCPATIIAAQQRYQLMFLRQPDDFYFNILKPSILNTRRLVRRLTNARVVDEISIVDNATTAAAIVLQHITWPISGRNFNPGDIVLVLHYGYGAVKKCVKVYVERAMGHVIQVDLPFPVRSSDEILDAFALFFKLAKQNDWRIRLAVIDHITSMPCVVMPVKEMVAMCRDYGVDKVFIDGAHAIGNVEVDLQDIGADYYTSNLHKWLFCPPSAAFLYCKETVDLSELHHPVVSAEFGNGLAEESSWVGTRDYSAQLVLPEVMEFVARFEGGIEGIRMRNHEKVMEMAEMLAEAWGTELGAPREMCSSLAMVGMPTSLRILNDEDAFKLRNYLRECFSVEVPIYYRDPWKDDVRNCTRTNGLVSPCLSPITSPAHPITGYARISHQVYNVVDDYYRLRDAVKRLVKEGFTCADLSK